jgi:hypothetical protein
MSEEDAKKEYDRRMKTLDKSPMNMTYCERHPLDPKCVQEWKFEKGRIKVKIKSAEQLRKEGLDFDPRIEACLSTSKGIDIDQEAPKQRPDDYDEYLKWKKRQKK